MPTTSSDFPPKSLQTKQKDCRFFSKNHSREFSRQKSFEDYQGGASASVPFAWESQPGTPKLQFRQAGTATDLPSDLTPPPSSYSSTATKRPIKKNSRPSNLLRRIFPSRKSRDLPFSPASSSSSSSSSFKSSSLSQSFYSVPSSPALNSHRRGDRMSSSSRLSFDLRMDEKNQHEYDDDRVPISTLCFSRGSVNDRSRGCYSSIIKVLLKEYE
ncbi:hypothetical protein I3843_13G056500 [Carya illinoinensis]|uniref:Uncharacterized protein n=1 Tax=Carya illinoinensis TaxID=32201 RepID=A0A8T1NGX1_CARIL|nr:hypothetical protein CIPAW_13G065900 [Carya illinoinensis]KAG7949332.1 hypothetical protein I3843_13G056500 [Carya illinoinensis]